MALVFFFAKFLVTLIKEVAFMSKNYKIAVLPGDGIGPEVMKEAVRVLDAVAD